MLSAYDEVERIISSAFDEICSLAEDVGIDGVKMLTQQHLADGCLLKGNHVPVINGNYKGRCYVFFKVFKANNGRYWPYFKLCTFKHGGVERVFNGWQWLKGHSVDAASSIQKIHWNQAPQYDPYKEDLIRFKRHQSLKQRYQLANFLDNSHAWVVNRFPGDQSSINWHSLPVRSCGKQLLVPIQQQDNGVVGFHVITMSAQAETKRHFVMRSGLMKGGFIELDGQGDGETNLPLLCEGLATGISLAMTWPGKVFVALSANNLRSVRVRIPYDQIMICFDNDQWSSVCNTGLLKSKEALCKKDMLCGPLFNSTSLIYKPTDFNDLQQLEGLAEVKSQLLRCAHGTRY